MVYRSCLLATILVLHKDEIAQWVPASGGSVPRNAVKVGYDKEDMNYVARARHFNEIIPGKVVPKHGFCYVPYGGKEYAYPQYEVLTIPFDSYFDWRPAYGSDIPADAFEGGHTAAGEPLYIGRVYHEGIMTSGKVCGSHSALYVSYGGVEYAYKNYEILCIRNKKF